MKDEILIAHTNIGGDLIKAMGVSFIAHEFSEFLSTIEGMYSPEIKEKLLSGGYDVAISLHLKPAAPTTDLAELASAPTANEDYREPI